MASIEQLFDDSRYIKIEMGAGNVKQDDEALIGVIPLSFPQDHAMGLDSPSPRFLHPNRHSSPSHPGLCFDPILPYVSLSTFSSNSQVRGGKINYEIGFQRF